MKRIKKLNNITNDTGYNTDYDTASAFIPSSIKNRALFLDIETTGFSAAKARLYLIGTAYVQDHVLVTEQFFAETDSPDEEAALIYEFDSLAAQFDTIVTFYGSRFDLPFLKGCQKRLHIPPAGLVYHNKNYVDLYLDFHAYKHIFALENYKLLSLEAFLGIKRMETRSGGELAGIYMEYIKKQTTNLSAFCFCIIMKISQAWCACCLYTLLTASLPVILRLSVPPYPHTAESTARPAQSFPSPACWNTACLPQSPAAAAAITCMPARTQPYSTCRFIRAS